MYLQKAIRKEKKFVGTDENSRIRTRIWIRKSVVRIRWSGSGSVPMSQTRNTSLRSNRLIIGLEQSWALKAFIPLHPPSLNLFLAMSCTFTLISHYLSSEECDHTTASSFTVYNWVYSWTTNCCISTSKWVPNRAVMKRYTAGFFLYLHKWEMYRSCIT